MAFSADFSVVQSGLSTLIFTDTSTGADATITERRIFLQKYDQTYLVPDGTTTDYIVWPIADSTITLTDILNRDYALDITVVWVTATPDPGNTYTAEQLQGYKAYTMVFLGTLLTQKGARYPNIVNNIQFNVNEANLYAEVSSMENAILVIQNIFLAQSALDRAYQMIQNPQFYFL